MISFEEYVEHMIKTEDENPYSDPVCMFPHWNAECYVDRRDPEHGCLNCPAAKKSYEKLDSECIQKYMKDKIEELREHLEGRTKCICANIQK